MAKARTRKTATKKNKKKSVMTAQKLRSGYAADIMPDQVDGGEAAGEAVPIANAKGTQRGRVPPSHRKYGAHYEAVSASEAQRRMSARARGDMETIEGGLDDTGISDEVAENLRMREKNETPDFDPLGPEPGDAPLVAEEEAMNPPPPGAGVATMVNPPVYVPLPQDDDPIHDYLARRLRVTLELADGSMSLSAIDVKQSRYGVTILLPLLDEGVTFIPKPGSEITVTCDDRSWDCYFPGTYFEAPELRLLGLVFVRKDEDNNG